MSTLEPESGYALDRDKPSQTQPSSYEQKDN